MLNAKYREKIFILKAIGNFGHTTLYRPVLDIIRDTRNTLELRVTAVYALRRIAPKVTHKVCNYAVFAKKVQLTLQYVCHFVSVENYSSFLKFFGTFFKNEFGVANRSPIRFQSTYVTRDINFCNTKPSHLVTQRAGKGSALRDEPNRRLRRRLSLRKNKMQTNPDITKRQGT